MLWRNYGNLPTVAQRAINFGFSILVLSKFIPTIYFGILTSLAMLVALVANMTLLPILIVVFRTTGVTRKKLAAELQ